MRLTEAEQLIQNSLSESAFTGHFLALCRLGNWAGYHVRRSDRISQGITRADGSGFPDWCIIHASTGRTLFVELKRQRGRVTDAQRRWLDLLSLQGEVYVWRPSDYDTMKTVLLYQGRGNTWRTSSG